jgi:hypothetical protein
MPTKKKLEVDIAEFRGSFWSFWYDFLKYRTIDPPESLDLL